MEYIKNKMNIFLIKRKKINCKIFFKLIIKNNFFIELNVILCCIVLYYLILDYDKMKMKLMIKLY